MPSPYTVQLSTCLPTPCGWQCQVNVTRFNTSKAKPFSLLLLLNNVLATLRTFLLQVSYFQCQVWGKKNQPLLFRLDYFCPRRPRFRDMTAFFSSMAWRSIPSPLSKLHTQISFDITRKLGLKKKNSLVCCF